MLSEPVLLLILFIVAAGLGWFFARRLGSPKQAGQLLPNSEYFKGVNYLLNEQPDRALEVFLKMVDVDQSTVETHFALGGLFRKRGEVDRAIRIHQNLMARPNLGRSERNAAMYALAQDYLSAGLLDRAEGLLRQVSQVDVHRQDALGGLIRIYESQKDWEKALLTHKNLLPMSASSSVAAHYHCELAQQHMASGDLKSARDELRKAKSTSRNHVRAALLRIQIAERQEDWKLVRKLCLSILQEKPDFTPLALGPLLKAVSALKSRGGIDKVLEQAAKRSGSAKQAIAYTALADPDFNSEVAESWVTEALRNNQKLQTLLGRVEPDQQRVAPDRAVSLLRALMPESSQFRCNECGLRGSAMYWLCPSCKTWDSTVPLTSISLELELESRTALEVDS